MSQKSDGAKEQLCRNRLEVKGKCERHLNVCKKDGVTKEQQEQIHAPIGLPIGANTPEEITVSIMAEMIQENQSLVIQICRKR